MADEKLYIGEQQDKFNQTSSEYLHVNSCGIQRTMGAPYRVIRKNGRVDYHILYIVTGECRACYGDKIYVLSPGGFVFYEPGHKQDYQFGKGIDTTSFWVHFHGTGAPSAVADCGISPGPHLRAKNSSAEHFFQLMVKTFYPGGKIFKTRLNGLLLMLLSELGEAKKQAAVLDKIAEAVSFIHLNYYLPIDINMLAKMSNLSRSRFLHVFKEQMGTSPLQYQQRFKMEKAKELLSVGSLSVSQVSAMVGFDDPFYFSRAFKNCVGMPPSAFRKAHGEK